MKQALRSQLSQCSSELRSISNIISSAPLDSRVQYLTMYALIKACGTVEVIFKSMIADFFAKSKIPQIHNFLDKTVREAATSPLYRNICTMLNKFDPTWKANFQSALERHPDKNRLISSVNSLVADRHQFAHGKNPPVTFSNILNYYNDAVTMLNILNSVLR